MAIFNLEKEAEKVKFVLAKKEVKDVIATVAVDIDISGSMRSLYSHGVVQRVVEKLLPVALNFDDNGELDVYTFSNDDNYCQVASATCDNHRNFVQREILDNPNVTKWKTTDYEPVLRANLEEYGFYDVEKKEEKRIQKAGFFAKMLGGKDIEVEVSITLNNGQKVLHQNSKSGYPAVIYFITDGENHDPRATYQLLKECQESRSNIYFLFIGIGNESFDFIKKAGDDFDNTGCFIVSDIDRAMTDDRFYDELLPEELCTWLKNKGEV